MLSGLTSRWTIPCSCAAPRPHAAAEVLVGREEDRAHRPLAEELLDEVRPELPADQVPRSHEPFPLPLPSPFGLLPPPPAGAGPPPPGPWEGSPLALVAAHCVIH